MHTRASRRHLRPTRAVLIVRTSRPWSSPDPGRTHRSFRRSRRHKLTLAERGWVLAYRDNGWYWFAGLSPTIQTDAAPLAVSEGDAGHRNASRVPKCTHDVPVCCANRRQEMPICRHFMKSLLTDSNRRPPPYHLATLLFLQIGRSGRSLIRRKTSRVSFLMCPFCVRALVP